MPEGHDTGDRVINLNEFGKLQRVPFGAIGTNFKLVLIKKLNLPLKLKDKVKERMCFISLTRYKH